jgi:hypothetical protein
LRRCHYDRRRELHRLRSRAQGNPVINPVVRIVSRALSIRGRSAALCAWVRRVSTWTQDLQRDTLTRCAAVMRRVAHLVHALCAWSGGSA